MLLSIASSNLEASTYKVNVVVETQYVRISTLCTMKHYRILLRHINISATFDPFLHKKTKCYSYTTTHLIISLPCYSLATLSLHEHLYNARV